MRIVDNAFNGRYADSPAALHRELLHRELLHRARAGRDVRAEHLWLQHERFAGHFLGAC